MLLSYMNWFIDVVAEGTLDPLFVVELPSIPVPDSFFPYTPLSGPAVVYKVEKVNIITVEKSTIDPAPVGPEPPSVGYSARVQLEVSIVP